MASLRTALQKITQDVNTANHPSAIYALRRRVWHSIKALTQSGDNLKYNCVMHAFGVAKDKELIGLVWRCPRTVHPNTHFIRFLKDQGLLVPLEKAVPGAIVVYSNQRAIRHAGRVINVSKVESKWGRGHVYQHGLMEIPGSYGNKVNFFTSPDRDTVVSAFVAFAKAQGARL